MKNHLLNFAVITATVAIPTVTIPFVGTQANAAGVTVGTLDFLTKQQQIQTNQDAVAYPVMGDPEFPERTVTDTADFGAFSRTLELRDITTPAGGGGPSAELGVPIGVTASGIFFNNGIDVMSDAYIRYDFDSAQDLTMGMADTLSIDVANADFSGQIGVIFNAPSPSDSADFDDVLQSFPTGGDDLHFLFEDFSVDFEMISSVEILIKPDTAHTNIRIDSITTTSKSTPEPGTLLGLTFAGVASLVTRRRQK